MPLEACPPTVQDYVDQESRPRLEPPRVPSSTLPQIGYCLPKERHIYVSKTLPGAFSNRLLFPPYSGRYTIRSRHIRPQKSHGRWTALIEMKPFRLYSGTHTRRRYSRRVWTTPSRVKLSYLHCTKIFAEFSIADFTRTVLPPAGRGMQPYFLRRRRRCQRRLVGRDG